jgi:hypothetical protein
LSLLPPQNPIDTFICSSVFLEAPKKHWLAVMFGSSSGSNEDIYHRAAVPSFSSINIFHGSIMCLKLCGQLRMFCCFSLGLQNELSKGKCSSLLLLPHNTLQAGGCSAVLLFFSVAKNAMRSPYVCVGFFSQKCDRFLAMRAPGFLFSYHQFLYLNFKS